MIDGKLAGSENCVLASGCRAERRVGGQGCCRQVNDSYARKFFLSARGLPITPVGSYGTPLLGDLNATVCFVPHEVPRPSVRNILIYIILELKLARTNGQFRAVLLQVNQSSPGKVIAIFELAFVYSEANVLLMREKRKSPKILLVDDSETVLMFERMILKEGNYELATAKDGREGIAKALALVPDLILLDVVMPNMNGFDALRELRRYDETRAIPVLMVTTKSEEQSMETAYLNGCNDYITKPIDSFELLTKIRNYLAE